MKGNTDNCHLLMTKDKSLEISIGESIVKSSDCKKLLGIKFDSKLHFWWLFLRSIKKVTKNYEH